MTPRRTTHPSYRTPLVIIVAVVLLVVLALFIHHQNTPKVSPNPVSTIHQLEPKPAANKGEKKLTATSGVNQGTATDTHGSQSATTTSPSQWTTSQSGLVTVKQPLSGGTLKSGDTVSGSARVSRVQYRLIDDQVGVISQGFISVVNGNFSAAINFPSYAKSGRLDVFNTNSDGAEINEVQLPVKLGE